MPHEVEHSTTAESVEKGDKLYWRSRWWTVESHPDTKVKYTTIHVEESVDPFRLERRLNVKVLRTEPTPAEVYGQRLSRWCSVRRTDLATTYDRLEAARAVFFADLEKWGKTEYYILSKMLDAEALHDIEAFIINRLYSMDGQKPRGREMMQQVIDRADDEDILTAYKEAVQRYRTEVWRSVGSGRSSSQLSNVIAEEKMNATREWVDNVGSYVEDLLAMKEKI